MLMAFVLFMISCRTEDASSDSFSSETQKEKAKVYLMKDVPAFKNFLETKINSANYFSKSNSYAALLFDNQPVDVVKKGNKTSYSTFTKKDDTVYEILVYTIGEKESFFIAQYISNTPIPYLDLTTFSGTVHYKSYNGELISSLSFENGIAKTAAKNAAKTAIGCYTVINTPVSCIEGLHFPGKPCAYAGTINAAYYDTQIINSCFQDEFYNEIGNGGSYGPDRGAGSNPAYSLPAPSAINYMLTQIGMQSLNTQQFSYLQNHLMEADNLRAYFLANQNVDNANFMYFGINFLMQNPATTWEQFLYNKHKGEPNASFDFNDNESGNYDETIFENFDIENQQTQWPTIANVISPSDFVGWNASGIRKNCMDYAKAQIAKKGYKISNYYDVDSQGNKQTFQIYTEQNGVNLNDLYKGVSYIKYALSHGIPVIVGIDDATGSPGNLDNSTDHFVVIVGMGIDSNGKFFRFYDNASGIDPLNQGANPENKLYYKYPEKIFTGKTFCIDYRNGTQHDYIITMIRKSK